MDKSQLFGSETAKNGFRNEDDIIAKFNLWLTDPEAKVWLEIMQYNLREIDHVKAVKLSGSKTDVQVQVTVKLKEVIDVQNLQVKLVSNMKGFNQIDKRWVTKYIEMWDIPKNISTILKKYTGEIKPDFLSRDKRRLFADELTVPEQETVLTWLTETRTLIISDILKGRGQFAAEWMLVAQKVKSNSRWVLSPMNYCLNHFGNGDIKITPKGNFKIGKITMQRKGGDGGRTTANMLQFKINPADLFDI